MIPTIGIGDYTKEQREKLWFLTGTMLPMLELASDHDVTQVLYAPRVDGSEGVWILTRLNDEIHVDVTGLRVWEILKAVVSALEGIY